VITALAVPTLHSVIMDHLGLYALVYRVTLGADVKHPLTRVNLTLVMAWPPVYHRGMIIAVIVPVDTQGRSAIFVQCHFVIAPFLIVKLKQTMEFVM